MDTLPATISVSIPERSKTTFLVMKTSLPFVPITGANLTVQCGDDPLPLIIGHASYDLTRGDVFVSASIPDVRRELEDGRSHRFKASELIAMLTSTGGFELDEVWDNPKPPR